MVMSRDKRTNLSVAWEPVVYKPLKAIDALPVEVDLISALQRINERISGSPTTNWYQHFAATTNRTFERALILNCGNGWVERELVEHGVSGLLVPERDVDALAEAIRELRGDPARRASLGQAGRQAVLERHDTAALHDQLELRLSSLLSLRRDRSARAAPASRPGS